MAHTYLADVDFSGKATEDSCGAHIAYTFDFQGGAASGFNTPLLFKSGDKPDISLEKLKALEDMGEDVTELRKSYFGQLMTFLNEAVREKYEMGWDWVYVVDADFDNGIVIFCSDYGMFSTDFTINGLLVEVGDVANPVVQTTDYQVVEGDVLVSVDFFDNLIDDALGSLVKGALKHTHVKDYLVKAHSARTNNNSVIAEDHPAEDNKQSSANTNELNKGDTPLDNINKEEFLKSAEFQDLIKAQVAEAVEKAAAEAKAQAQAEAQEEIQKARAQAEELLKAEAARIESDYTLVIKSYEFVEEDKVETLVKYLIENNEVAETVVKAFSKAREEIEAVKKEFGKEIGVEASNPELVAKSASELIQQKANLLKQHAQK